MEELSAVINDQKYEREYIYDNESLLKTTFTSFIIEVIGNKSSTEQINSRINTQLSEFLKDNTNRLFPEAIEVYKESIANNYPIRPFESYYQYVATYNEKNFLSAYRDRYDYTGGAHGNTIRKSDTWSLISGRILPLASFYPQNSNYQAIILKQILEQAKKNYETNPGIYFENYQELIVKYFNPQNYYLSENGISIYYQQYEIAPYSSGIIVFEINN